MKRQKFFLILSLIALIGFQNAPAQKRTALRNANFKKARAGQALNWEKSRNDYLMQWDGVDRHFIVYIPESYTGKQAVPVVFMFHGTTGTGDKFYRGSRWKEAADRENFIAVFPTSWKYYIPEDGRSTTKWNELGLDQLVEPGARLMDDVGFVREICKSLKKSLQVDEKRFFASGFSNGGRFVNTRIAVEMNDTFAAIATGAGLLRETININGPILPAYTILGSQDQNLVDYLGKEVPMDPEALMADPIMGDVVLTGFLNTFQLEREYQVRQNEHHTTLRFAKSKNGRDQVFYFTVINGMGHNYPNETNNPQGWVAADHFWKFFQRHPKD